MHSQNQETSRLDQHVTHIQDPVLTFGSVPVLSRYHLPVFPTPYWSRGSPFALQEPAPPPSRAINDMQTAKLRVKRFRTGMHTGQTSDLNLERRVHEPFFPSSLSVPGFHTYRFGIRSDNCLPPTPGSASNPFEPVPPYQPTHTAQLEQAVSRPCSRCLLDIANERPENSPNGSTIQGTTDRLKLALMHTYYSVGELHVKLSP
ncbi:hypothetical protein QBC39DRAFT_356529 [Podospora conica]|nr:hypothetical protein QBC39DRAFT_356529 [Schizothecium conicum]